LKHGVHLSDEPGELSQWLSWWQHREHCRKYNYWTTCREGLFF